jgi:hypothetical protein
MPDMQHFQSSLDRMERNIDKLLGMEAKLEGMSERSKYDSERIQEIKNSVKDIAEDGILHEQRLKVVEDRSEKNSERLDKLESARDGKLYEEGKKAGIMVSVAYVTDILKPYLIPAAIVVAGWFVYERQPTAVPVNAIPTHQAPSPRIEPQQ